MKVTFAERAAWTLIGLACASGCSGAYEPPLVRILDDGGRAADSTAPPPDASTGNEDASFDGMADSDASLADNGPSQDIRTLASDVGAETFVDADARADAPVADRTDAGPIERPDACVAPDTIDAHATVTWTIGSDPSCSASTAVQCPYGGNAVTGTYAIRADGFCPSADFRMCTPSTIILWFPGTSPPVSQVYDIYPVARDSDVHNIPVRNVVLEVQEIQTQKETWWGQSGQVQLMNTGATAMITLSNVHAMEEASSATTTIAGELTCP